MRMVSALVAILALGALTACVGGGREPGIGRTPDKIATTRAVPKGFGEVVTEIGPVFTDRSGLSLYVRTRSEPCTADRDPPPSSDVHPLWKLYYEVFVPPTCLAQHPAVTAEPGDRDVGDWTIVTTKDGRRQWAYKGQLVHRSYKDHLPGDLNGNSCSDFCNSTDPIGGSGWAPAMVPVDVPPGVVSTYRPGLGMVATTQQGMTLYTLNPAETPASDRRIRKVSIGCRESCNGHLDNAWRPFLAGETAVAATPWSVLRQDDGNRVWGYHGEPIFTYANDAAGDIKGLSRGAEPVVLYPLPKAPPGITITRTHLGLAYANAEGKTLYVFRCNVGAPEGSHFDCDSWNDDVRYREQHCPAPNRCGERWIPVYAPDSTQPKGGLWSIVTVPDPRYLFRWVPSGGAADTKPGAVKIWSYRGMPVFSVTTDLYPGEVWGELYQTDGISGSARFMVVFAGPPRS